MYRANLGSCITLICIHHRGLSDMEKHQDQQSLPSCHQGMEEWTRLPKGRIADAVEVRIWDRLALGYCQPFIHPPHQMDNAL